MTLTRSVNYTEEPWSLAVISIRPSNHSKATRTQFKDDETFLCFDFVSDEFCGKVDIPLRSKYTKQIFDFFDKHFPGVNIGEGTR